MRVAASVANALAELPAGGDRSTGASATASVVAVDIHDGGAFTSSDPPPRVGQTKRLRLRDGVITEPFIGTNYCDRRAGRKGTCGA